MISYPGGGALLIAKTENQKGLEKEDQDGLLYTKNNNSKRSPNAYRRTNIGQAQFKVPDTYELILLFQLTPSL